jgi:hypothetical protein
MIKLKFWQLNTCLKSVTVVATLLVISCKSNPLDVDVSSVQVDLTVERMEQEIFNPTLNTSKEYEALNTQLYKQYGLLYEIWLTKMLGEIPPSEPLAGLHLMQFAQHPDMKEIYSEIQQKFSDFSNYKEKFEQAFSYYAYYFPDSTLPRIVTFYSNFNANVFPVDGLIAIGLEMYLGPENKIIKSLPIDMFPQYLINRMDEKYLVADAMKFYLLSKFSKDHQGADFLTTIVELGKVMYLLDAVMPFESDEIKMGYTSSELLWCKDFEREIWKTIVDEGVLYSKDKVLITQFLNEGPFTKGLPPESPSRVGVWLGWQIVRDYMISTDVSVHELLAQTSAKVILKYYSQGER